MNKNVINISVGQFDVKIAQKDENIRKMLAMTQKAKMQDDADIIVFPECALCGYTYDDFNDMANVAEQNDGSTIQIMEKAANENNIVIVYGFIEKNFNNYYNCAVWIEPGGEKHYYRKTHLPYLGVDRFLERGNEIQVFETRFGKVGLTICYDLRFPEATRQLAIQGARIIIQPTNYPVGGEVQLDILSRARACENRVYLVSCNRVGLENGVKFLGRSQIIDHEGMLIKELDDHSEEVVTRTLDLSKAEEKDLIREKGVYELYLFKHRRPELYSELTKV